MKTKRPSRFSLRLWGICLLGALALGSCRPLFQRELAAPVLSLEGGAQGTRHGNSVALTKGSWVHPGEKITTAAGARLALMLVPGVLLELAGDTEIEIEQLRLERNGNENIHPMLSREATIRLRRGTLVGALSESQKRSKMTLQTSAGTLTVFDLRTFKIKVDGDGTRILSVRGNAIFQRVGGGPPLTIGAGYFAEWPANPEPRAALSDRSAQAEVTPILRTEKRLFNLQKQFGLTFVPWRP
jgi:hypothetical protein